jgi:hypothetical protein
MIYAELAALDSTPDQDLGLTIQFKEDTQTTAPTPGAYLALVVGSVLDSYVSRHVGHVQKARIADAFDKATDAEKQAVAAALKIDLTVSADAVAAEDVKR